LQYGVSSALSATDDRGDEF